MTTNDLLNELYEVNENAVSQIEEALLIYSFDNLPLKEIKEMDDVDVLPKDDFLNYYLNEASFSDFLANLTDEENDQVFEIAKKLSDICSNSHQFYYAKDLLEMI